MARLEDFHRVVLDRALLQARDALDTYGENWAAATRDEAPEGTTGDLKNSIRWVKTGDLSGQLEMSGIGRFVDEGTRPHVIRARNARSLRFTMGGSTVFARSVHHPGTRPNPFIQRGATRAGLVARGGGYGTPSNLIAALRDAAMRGLARIFR